MTKPVRNVLLHEERTKKLFSFFLNRGPGSKALFLGAKIVEVMSWRQPPRLIRG